MLEGGTAVEDIGLRTTYLSADCNDNSIWYWLGGQWTIWAGDLDAAQSLCEEQLPEAVAIEADTAGLYLCFVGD
jgi:hypothetical protein